MSRLSRVAPLTACLALFASTAQAGPIPFDSLIAYAWIQTGAGGLVEQSNYDTPLAQATVNTPEWEQVTATAFQGVDGNSGVNVTTGSLASGESGQVVAQAQTSASATFVATAATNYDFSFRVSGISLGVNGDYGGSGPPATNPFTNSGASTVGAQIFFSVGLVNVTQGTLDDMFVASLDVWGHGDYFPATRYYTMENQQNVSATMEDQFCLPWGCYGKKVTVDPIQAALSLGTLTAGDTYKLNVLMYSRIAARPYENDAWARIYDPNDLSTFSLTSSPAGPPPPVPEPSALLLLLGSAMFGARAVRRRR